MLSNFLKRSSRLLSHKIILKQAPLTTLCVAKYSSSPAFSQRKLVAPQEKSLKSQQRFYSSQIQAQNNSQFEELFNAVQAALKDAESFFEQRNYAEVETLYARVFETLYTVDLKSMQIEDNNLFLAEFETMLANLKSMKAKKHDFQVLPPFKAYWGASGVFQQIGNLELANDLIDKAFEDKNEIEGFTTLMKISKGSIKYALSEKTGDEKLAKDAIALHQEAIKEIGTKIAPENGLQVATAYWETGNYYKKQKKTEAALSAFARAFSVMESYFGWSNPFLTTIAVELAKSYFESGAYELGVIVAEKALIGVELYYNQDPHKITDVGIYLARGYEKRRQYEMQQSSLSKTLNLLKRFEEQYDPQEFMECQFRVMNLMGACRFFRGEYMMALSIYQKQQKNLGKVFGPWEARNSYEANFEAGYMNYFRGTTFVSLEHFEKGINSLLEARNYFETANRSDWVKQCEQNIAEAKELEAKHQQKQAEGAQEAPAEKQ